MDILAHGLWTQLVFKDSPPETRILAVALSIAPDAIAFIPNIVYAMFSKKWKVWMHVNEETFDTVAKEVPPWVYRIYDVTHSIPLWIVGFAIVWMVIGHVPWVAFAWLMHILIDIPTHTKKFFPTPFLWPISRFTIDGLPWERRWYMAANYGSLALLYLYFYVIR